MTTAPMPRCASCKFWKTAPLLGGNGTTLGGCLLTVHDTGAICRKTKLSKALAQPASGSFLQTHAEFGCVQHQPEK